MKLEDRVALVTGATSGIGRETARVLASEGARVAITGRRVERLERLAEEIRADAAGAEVIELPGDVTDPETTASWIEETVGTFGGLDVLVNSAGIIATGGLRDTSDEVWSRMMDVNFWGLMQLTRSAVPHLIERGGGSIVNVSSVCSYRPFPTITAYCVSKAAVDMFTECLALELAPHGVRVNAVNPGVVVSELHTATGAVEDYDAFLERGKATHPLGRVGQPEDVARLVLFLASDESSWITGGCHPVDGGRNLLSAR
jgi:NAD(P)-dependent dehydrogenase (short-subunit alcohol dehydrogenase family)